MNMFVSKYSPKDVGEFVGHKESVKFFFEWIKTLKPKALIFHGPPGIGKTSLVNAFATENNYDVIEINASDFRSAEAIKKILGKSVTQKSFFDKNKIFVIEEVDGLSSEDKGGVGEIIKLIKESRYPIVLTANNPWDAKLRPLRQYCKLVEFKKLSMFDIHKRLQKICESENINIDKDILRTMSANANGDLRAAINDLQSIAYSESKNLEDLGQREKLINIFDALKIIFKTQSAKTAKLAINSTDKDVDEIFWWIENNITNEYEDPKEIAEAFEKLSKADLMKHRIMRKQNWKLLAYVIDLMTAGVSCAKKDVYRKFTRYSYPENIAILGSTKEERSAAKDLHMKLSKELHCSSKSVKTNFLPYLKIITKDNLGSIID